MRLLLGNIALLGYPLLGHVVAQGGGTSLYARFVAELLRKPDKWRIISPKGDSNVIKAGPSNLIEVVSISPQILRMLKQDIATIHSLSPDLFEQLICDRLEHMGLEVRRVGKVNAPDGGVDIVAWPKHGPVPFLIAVQAKHHRSARKKTGEPAVKHLLSTVQQAPFQAGLLVTSTTFSPNAQWFASHQPHLVRLRDISDLVRWISGRFLDAEEWREIPSRIQLAPRVFVDIPRPAPDEEN